MSTARPHTMDADADTDGGNGSTSGYELMQARSQQGSLNPHDLRGGLICDTTTFATHGIPAVVIEPSRALLLALGWMCLTARRRRRQAHAGVLPQANHQR